MKTKTMPVWCMEVKTRKKRFWSTSRKKNKSPCAAFGEGETKTRKDDN